MSTQTIPEQIGPYRVLRPIGQGGMSEVFVVEDPSTEERLALKLLVEAGDAIPRFDREYEALIRLNHPGIVRVYNYGSYNGRPWFSMELLEGNSLQSWMKRCGRPGQTGRTAEVIRVAFYLTVALAYIHRRNLIHRDLKSANVMVLPDGRVKLLDFGTAHLLDPVETITQEGEFIGTFAYASPEQFRGGAIDHRADLYTLGVLLYRLATGRRPFVSEDPAALARMHLREEPTPPIKHVPALPEALNELILKLMAKKPDDRPQKASEVVRQLVEIAGRPINMSGFGLAMRCDRPIGRERELKTIERVLDGTAGRSILVTGPHGSGLSGFVNMAAMDARARGMEVVTCTLKETDPMGTFLQTLLAFSEPKLSTGSPESKTAMAGLRDLLDRAPIERWKHREVLHVAAGSVLFQALKQTGSSMVFVIHHQHFATPPTMDLFGKLAHIGQGEGVSLQYVFAADASKWSPAVNPRQRFPGALHLHLKSLSVRQVALTVGSMLYRRPPPDRLARVIHQLSGGEPIWVEQVVQHLVDTGQLRALGAEGNHLEWDSDGIRTLSIPQDAADVIASRLTELPVFAARCLEALAVSGLEDRLDLLARAMGWKPADLIPVLEFLVKENWLDWVEHGVAVVWARTLDASIIDKQMDSLRREIFMRALGRMVDELPPSETLVAVLLANGQTRRGMEMALVCAKKWMDDQAVLKALALLDEVVEAVRGRPELDRIFAGRLHLMHADCLMRVRPTDPRLSRSLGTARSLANKQVTLATIELLQARLHRQLGHYPGFQKYVERAWEHVMDTDDWALKSKIASYQMLGWLYQGRTIKAMDWLQIAVEQARRTQNERVMAYADIMAGQVAFVQGRLTEAEKTLDGAMRVFERTKHARGLWLALPVWSEILRYQGRYSEALGTLYRELPAARGSHVPLHYLQILLGIARCETDLCRLGKAQDCVDELEVNIRRGEQLSLRLDTMLLKGRIQIMSGQFRKALAVLQEAYERARSAGLPVISESARALMAEALWGLNSRDQASGMYESACLGLMATGHMAGLVLAVSSWAHGMGAHADPETIFAPVKKFLENEPAEVLQMEFLIARGRFFRRNKQGKSSRYSFQKAAAQLKRLAKQLNDTDQAALRVHPWSVHIRVGIR